MNPEYQRRAINVLLVEDNPAAARLATEALRDAKVRSEVHVVSDGEAALDFLYQRAPFASSPRPDIILLDLGLPKINGKQVLAALKSDANLETIPVVVLTNSDNPHDINDAYRHHVSCYITKPSGIDEYFMAIRSLKELWFNAAVFPKAVLTDSDNPPQAETAEKSA